MNTEAKEILINSLKRDKIEMPLGAASVSYGLPDIQKIIPHRNPFVLVSTIHAIHIEQACIEVSYLVNPKDPVFAGHFPGMPVFPGVFQIESMGQAGLCLSYFIKNKTTQINEKSKPVQGLFTRVHNAGFNKAVKPGDVLTIRVKSIEDDDFMGVMQAQALVNNEIYSHSILEVYYP
ncbi:MAG: beta-hydroxyacyl-ACP dehydratase [Bacteroidetes bacterium]|nr:beta-hydroxyacyl-ACP dehydratase [Bacteroidota bacterium]